MVTFTRIALALFFSTSLVPNPNALAQTPQTVKEVMEVIVVNFKSIGQKVNDVSQNPTSIELTKTLAAAIHAGVPLVPSKIQTLPAAEQRAQQLVYQKLMTQLLLLSLNLEEQLTANNNTEAKKTLNEMVLVRNKGHELFKP